MNSPQFRLAALVLILCGSSLGAFDLGNVPIPKDLPAPVVIPESVKKTVDLAKRSNDSLEKANEDLTPLQQYYLGRAFGATILESRKPVDNAKANAYVNELGQALVQASEQPATYSGYRFQIVDSAEINAFSGPGGFIFISKGLVKLTHDEGELAAVLAHEIGHVALEHGVKAIQKDRQTGALVGIGADAAKTYGSDDAKGLAASFESSVTDLTKNIVDKGYSRETEFEADARAVTVLRRAGYSPRSLVSMLEELKKQPQGNPVGFAKTHPAPQDRITQASKLVAGDPVPKGTPAQAKRFKAALDGL